VGLLDEEGITGTANRGLLGLNSLSQELGLSESQEKALLGERKRIIQERRNLIECERMLERFRAQSQAHVEGTQKAFEHVGRELQPAQLARFLVWVQRNMWYIPNKFCKFDGSC